MKRIICIIGLILGIFLLIITFYYSYRSYYTSLDNGRNIFIYYKNRFYNENEPNLDDIYRNLRIGISPDTARVWHRGSIYTGVFRYSTGQNSSDVLQQFELSDPEYIFLLKFIDSINYKKLDWDDVYNTPYDGISLHIDYRDGRTDSVWTLNKPSFQKCSVIFLVEFFLYAHKFYPRWMPIYLVAALIFPIIIKKYWKSHSLCFKNTVKYIWHKTAAQRKFLFAALIPTVFSLMLYNRYFGAYLEKLLESVDFSLFYIFYDNTQHASIAKPIYGINIFSWVIITALEVFMLYKITKNKRYPLSFTLGTFIQLLLQRFLFLSLLGKNRDINSRVMKICYYWGIIEPIKYHSKIIVFMLFLLTGIAVYFIAGAFTEKNKYKNLSWSTSFAAVNAFMCCLPIYVLNFWCFAEGYYLYK